VFRWDGRAVERVPAAAGVTVDRAIKPYLDRQGQLWFTARDKVVGWDPQSANLVDARIGPADLSIYRDSQGVWWTGNNGLQRRAPDSTVTYRRTDGLPSDTVTAIAPAGQNALWVGTDAGLARFEEEGLQVLSTRDGLPRNVVTRVAVAPDDAVWFTCPQSDSLSGGGGDTLCRYDGRSVTRFGREQGLGAFVVGGLHVDSDGTVWVGAGGNSGRGNWFSSPVTGVWRSEGGQFVGLDAVSGLNDVRAGAIQRGADGRLWVAAEHSRESSMAGPPAGPDPRLRLRGGARTRRRHVVRHARGAFRWNERILTAWTRTNGFDQRVHALAVSTNGAIWIGTPRALPCAESVRSARQVVRRGCSRAASGACSWIATGCCGLAPTMAWCASTDRVVAARRP
jgi:ligand-binding sensor domain-containing protein